MTPKSVTLWFGPAELILAEKMHDEAFNPLEDVPPAEVSIVALGSDSSVRAQNREDGKNQPYTYETLRDSSHNPSLSLAEANE